MLLGWQIIESRLVPENTVYLLPNGMATVHPSFDWPWQLFLWEQRQLGRRYLARIVQDTEARLGLPDEPVSAPGDDPRAGAVGPAGRADDFYPSYGRHALPDPAEGSLGMQSFYSTERLITQLRQPPDLRLMFRIAGI